MEEILQGFDIEIDEAQQSAKLADVNIILFDGIRDDFKEISPTTRKAIIKSTLQKGYASLKKDFKLKNPNIVIGTRIEPRVINDKIVLKSVPSLKDKPYVKKFHINSIEGMFAMAAMI